MATKVVHKEGTWISLVESELPPENSQRVVKFGPLSTTLTELFRRGFILEASGRQTIDKRMVKIHLVNRSTNERYLIGQMDKIPLCHSVPCLSDYVKQGVQMIKRGAAHTHKSVDPFEQLMSQYPPPPIKMIGNQTVREYVINLVH